MARKKDEGTAGGSGRLTPVDVQQVQFRRALRGYDEQEVDDFLDRVTEELTLLIDERRSAAERAGSLPTVRVASAGDATAANREAEELLRQARERADAIVREANQRATATIRDAEARSTAAPAAAAAGAGVGVGAFLAKEREFLQRLAALVQGHAEGVKGMVAASRESAGTAAAASSGATSASDTSASGSPADEAGDPGSQDPSGGSSGGAGATGGSGPPPSAASGSGGPGAVSVAGGAAVATATATREVDEPTVILDEDAGPSTAASGAAAGPGLPDLPQQPPELSTPIEGSAGVRGRPATGTTGTGSSDAVAPSAERTPASTGGDDATSGPREDASLRELFWGED
ncbi:MAG TPA: DivIVA domain-containing protein [Actinomycetota bacterium]